MTYVENLPMVSLQEGPTEGATRGSLNKGQQAPKKDSKPLNKILLLILFAEGLLHGEKVEALKKIWLFWRSCWCYALMTALRKVPKAWIPEKALTFLEILPMTSFSEGLWWGVNVGSFRKSRLIWRSCWGHPLLKALWKEERVHPPKRMHPKRSDFFGNPANAILCWRTCRKKSKVEPSNKVKLD